MSCTKNVTTGIVAHLFFDNWVKFQGFPRDIARDIGRVFQT